jgi:hypothetical protein
MWRGSAHRAWDWDTFPNDIAETIRANRQNFPVCIRAIPFVGYLFRKLRHKRRSIFPKKYGLAYPGL